MGVLLFSTTAPPTLVETETKGKEYYCFLVKNYLFEHDMLSTYEHVLSD
jgi:hypothetical protein